MARVDFRAISRCFLFLSLPTAIQAQSGDFFYRPYPILLVHGLNGTPGDFGTWTRRNALKPKELKYSTLWNNGPYTGGFFNAPDATLTQTLFYAFVPDAVKGPGYDLTSKTNLRPRDFKDFMRLDPSASPAPDRYVPSEEPGSYSGVNHSFLEAYDSYYEDESNDGKGVRYPKFGIDPNSPDYETSLGGQSQLLRIRIIQMLNEYYGDWKWVGDPTAKVKIIAHSNGGVVVATALATDDQFWNQGSVGENGGYLSWWKAQPGSTDRIDGRGFRLRDHVDQVLTIDSPLSGTPAADQAGRSLVFGTDAAAVALPIIATYIPHLGVPGSIFALLAAPYVADVLANFINDQFVGIDLNSPAIKDDVPGSALLKSIHGHAPAYSPDAGPYAGSKIPFANVVGTYDLNRRVPGADLVPLYPEFMTAFYIATSFCICPTRWYKAALWALETNLVLHALDWYDHSDLLVPAGSQDVRDYLFPDANSDIMRKHKIFHYDVQNTVRDTVPFLLSRATSLNITHAIGENQAFGESDVIQIPHSAQVQVSELGPDFTTLITNPLHDIVQFKGMVTPDPSKAWPGNRGGTITMDVNTGVPKYIVGNLSDYYMNSDAVRVFVNGALVHPLVNGSPADQLAFYQHFGKWDSRYVDVNGDGAIGAGDFLQGSVFFAPAFESGKSLFALGRNRVEMRLTSKFGPPQVAAVSVRYGTDLGVYEADANGNPVAPRIFNQSVRWNVAEGERKTFYLGFNTPINPDALQDAVALAQSNGPELPLQRVGTTPLVGQFRLVTAPNGQVLAQVALTPDQLKQEGGQVVPDQLLHVTMVNSSSQPVVDYSAFYVDNEGPKIQMRAPLVAGDYNHDGMVDGSDVCPVTNLPAQTADCSQICSEDNLTGSDCATAMRVCQEGIASKTIRDPSCDGIDNDFDGFVDELDENPDMPYYSPQFDASGALTSKPVSVEFTATDNLQDILPRAKSIAYRVYKVSGSAWSPSDPVIYTRTFQGDELQFGRGTTDAYRFQGLDRNNPDGLYAVVVTAVDQAGQVGSDETQGPPAYFIVDTKPPSIHILSDWQDNLGNPAFTPDAASFKISYVPGDGSGLLPGPWDSETRKVTVRFQPVLRLASFTAQQDESYPLYQDQFSFTADGRPQPSGYDHPDGKLDPTEFHVLKPSLSLDFFQTLRIRPPDGYYDVSLVAEDKAGNTRVYPVKRVQVATGYNGLPVTPSGTQPDINPILSQENLGGLQLDLTSTQQDESHDRYGLATTTLQGDFTLTTQITAADFGDPQAIAGLIATQDLGDGAPSIAILTNASNQILTRTRSDMGEPYSQSILAGTYAPPAIWLRIQRQGSVVTVYVSSDGRTFSVAGSLDLGTDPLYVGYVGGSANHHRLHVSFGPPQVGPNPLDISPVLEKTWRNCDGTYTASFGYKNPNGFDVLLPFGTANRFSEGGQYTLDLGQTTDFLPGRVQNAFQVNFDGSPLVWTLNAHTSTASGAAAQDACPIPPAVSPVLEKVDRNCSGTYTAHFGYNNPNATAVALPIGSLNQFSYQGTNGQNLGQPTYFLVGRHQDIFQVDFDGSNLVWSLNGHTATASQASAVNLCPTTQTGDSAVSPILEKVVDRCDGGFRAYFGYRNGATSVIRIPIGARNGFTYGGKSGLELGQPQDFQPGRMYSVFEVDFDGTNLVWNLGGHTSTANKTQVSNQCRQ